MAHLLLKSMSVSDAVIPENPTVLAVHRMLGPPIITQPQAETVQEDSDVFQCGKCKKQYSSIEAFVNHKAECTTKRTTEVGIPSNICSISQNAVVLRKIEIPQSLSNYPQSLILTEADFLQLTGAGLESNISTAAAEPSIQISSNHQIITHPSTFNNSAPFAQHVLQQLNSQDSQIPHTVELSFLNDKLVSRPIILASQDQNGTVQNLILNIEGSAQPETVICSTLAAEKEINAAESAAEPALPCSGDSPEAAEQESSTLNAIAELEFRGDAVKNCKLGSKNDDQSKKDSKLNCGFCSKTFAKNFDLQQHIRSHTGEKPFQCIVCGRAFAQKSNVKKHMQTHKVWPDGLAQTLPSLPPRDNSVVSSDDDQNENSEAGNLAKSSYVCQYCKNVFKSYFKLKSHLKDHEREKVYKCILLSCGQMYNDLEPFLEHVRSHENELTYDCTKCDKSFTSLSDLGSHQYSHASKSNSKKSKRSFPCNYCLNKYSTAAALNHHIATTSHSYSCSLCTKVFPCERYLRRHLQIHSEPKSFTCKLCGKGFKTENYLKVHMLVHSEDKPFSCPNCKAAFNRKDKLKRHLLIHETVKRFKCPFRMHYGCSKEFSRRDKLTSHILSHSSVKPFVCKVCGKRFSRNVLLKDHAQLCHVKAQDMPAADESENSDKRSPTKSSPGCDYKKPRKRKKICKNLVSRTKRKGDKVLCGKTKKNKVSDMLTVMDESSSEGNVIDCAFDLTGDIPTAHIEIISADGSLVSSSELGQISLESDMNYGDLQFESHVSDEAMPSNNSLLTNELSASSSRELS